jgi:hypothetical protein
VKRGLLSVLLGETAPIPDAITFDRPYWLGIQVGSGTELLPRTELTAVGYSFRSVRADTAQFAKEIASGTVVRGVNGITDELTLLPGSNISIDQIGNALRISAGGGGGSLLFPLADTSASDEAVLALTNTGFGGAVSGESKQGGIGVFGQSNTIGVAGFSSGGTGVQGGGPIRGLYGLSDLGTGIEGGHTLPTGNGPGVYGWSASAADRAYGVFGELTGNPNGIDAYAVRGLNRLQGLEGGFGGEGKGVYGLAKSSSAAQVGVYGESRSTRGFGVYGEATAESGDTRGVFGLTWSSGGIGVEGRTMTFSGATIGVEGSSNSTSGKGVAGSASAVSGLTYGVYGSCLSNAGFGVYSLGNMAASGTKSFRIDHPKDPAGKYLLHYSAESPDVLNIYTGNVVTDAAGIASIDLPEYFEDINKDPRYTLTVINEGGLDFVHVMVVQKIRDNRFVIRTSKPSTEVSWEVKAIRNDLWVRAAGAPVQKIKEGEERGKYQNPALYGMPEDMGTNFRPSAESIVPDGVSRRTPFDQNTPQK